MAVSKENITNITDKEKQNIVDESDLNVSVGE